MLLSIVIPTYNRSESLKKCLQALQQCLVSAEDVDVVVVDDCSHDGHKPANSALCETRGFHYHWLAENRGPAHARNFGTAGTTGEWVAFLDDDVCVDKQWLLCLRNALLRAGKDTLGIEGVTRSLGTGLWDSEVENLKGGLFLSCNIAFRRDVLVQAGGFDEEFCGPFAEDHELACRIKKRGNIVFEKELVVYHVPRNIRLVEYCKNSFRRMRMMLDAELYFYSRHKDRYHSFRYAPTFWHGLLLILFKHAFSAIRRRRTLRLLLNPLQTVALIVSSVLEQIAAWVYLPRYCGQFFNTNGFSIENQIHWIETSQLWDFYENTEPSVLQFSPSLTGSLLFRIQKQPVYDARSVYNKTRLQTGAAVSRIFIRIDDMFFDDPALVNRFCDSFKENTLPFLAAVTGNDLQKNENGSMIQNIIRCGGAIGVHGFSHTGRFGPYESEILQMSFPQLDGLNTPVLEACRANDVAPVAFVPPFNAVSWEQIAHLGGTYPIICGGPETIRFTGYLYGPVVLDNGSIYFPCCQPFYGRGSSVITPAMYTNVMHARAPVCLTFHFHAEAEDNFSSLLQCFQLYQDAIKDWHTLCEKNKNAVKDV